MYIATLYIIG